MGGGRLAAWSRCGINQRDSGHVVCELIEADRAISVLIHLMEQPLHLRAEGGSMGVAEGGRERRWQLLT